MEKVTLPKVKKNNRIELNTLKAQRDDNTLDTTIEYLLILPKLSTETIKRLDSKREWVNEGTRPETDDELVNRLMDYMEEMPTEFIGRAIKNAMGATKEEIDTWIDFSEEFRKWLKKFAKDVEK